MTFFSESEVEQFPFEPSRNVVYNGLYFSETSMASIESKRIWTVAEAKARLSEVLRLAECRGAAATSARASSFAGGRRQKAGTGAMEPPVHLGRWLVNNDPPRPRLGQYPFDRQSDRRIP